MKDPGISVVIPNYNGVHLFPDTLPPLYAALENSGQPFEIIVSDDHSSDGSVTFLEKSFPDIRLVTSSLNSGFSKTINRGIEQARYGLVLLLNSDVRLQPDYFQHQLHYFAEDSTFGVMGKIIGWDDDRVQDAAKFPKFDGFKLKTSYNYLPDDNLEGPFYTMYLSGANALVSREKLNFLGRFDEIYSPFYMEDVDLSVRAWEAGFKCFFEPRSVCRHRTSASISNKEKKHKIRVIYNRNKFYFHIIHLKGLRLFGWCLQTLFEIFFRLLTGRSEYFFALRSFLGNISTVKRSISRNTRITASLPGKHSLTEIVKLVRLHAKVVKKTIFKS